MIKAILTVVLPASGIIGIFTAAILARLKKVMSENEAERYGVQALLRHELYEMYNEYCLKRKQAPISVKEDFENMYKRYHELGSNGVMDGIHEEFRNLPTHTTHRKGGADDH